MSTPQRPFWKRKRFIAAAAAMLAGLYLLTFIPTSWALLRIDAEAHPTEWAVLVAYNRPTAALLMACPESVRDSVIAAINYGQPKGGWTMYENMEAGMGIGIYRLERPGIVADVRLW